MEIPAMTIAQETMIKLNAPHIHNKGQRRRIRIEGVKALIRSKPMNYEFKLIELMQAAGYHANRPGTSIYWAGQSFISGLIKNRIIIKNYGGRVHSSTYTVAEDIKVKKAISDSKESTDHKKAQIVERTVDSLTSVAPKHVLDEETTKCEDKTSEVISFAEESSSYTISFRISKKVEDNYDKKDVAYIEINDTTLSKAQHMVNELIEKVR